MNRPLNVARDALILSCIAMVCVLGLLLFGVDGPQAVATMAGAPTGKPALESLRLMLAFDTLLPISYGAGFVLLAVGFAGPRTPAALVFGSILFTAIGVSMDFLENGLAMNAVIYGADPMLFATILKYGALGISAVLLSAILEPRSAIGKLAVPVLRFVTPISLSVLLSGWGGESAVWFFVIILLGTFLFLTAVAHFESNAT